MNIGKNQHPHAYNLNIETGIKEFSAFAGWFLSITTPMLYQHTNSRYHQANLSETSILKNHPAPPILLLGILFGFGLIGSRFSLGQFALIDFVGLRLTLASLGFIALILLSRGKQTWPKGGLLWQRSTILGVFGTAVPMMAFVGSMQFQSSGITSVLITLSPAITVLLAHFMLEDECLTLPKSIGIALAFSGALFLALRGESGLASIEQANPAGYGLVFLGIACASWSNIYIRKKMDSFAVMDVAAIRMISAAFVMLPVMLLTTNTNYHQVNISGWVGLILVAVFGTFFAFLLDFSNIQRFGASTAVMVSYFIPVVGVWGGALLLDEQITSGMLGGMLLILVGLWLVMRRQTTRVHDSNERDIEKGCE